MCDLLQSFISEDNTLANCHSIGEALITAVQTNNLNLCKKIIDLTPDYNYDLYYHDAFCRTCQYGYLDIAQYLRSVFTDINYCDFTDRRNDLFSYQTDVFSTICHHGYLDLFEWLLEIWPEAHNGAVEKYLKIAVERHHHRLVQFIIDTWPNLQIDSGVRACLNYDVDVISYINDYARSTNNVEIFADFCSIPDILINPFDNLHIAIPQNILDSALEKACYGQHLHTIKWLSTLSTNYTNVTDLFLQILRYHDIDVAKFLHELWPQQLELDVISGIFFYLSDSPKFRKFNKYGEKSKWIYNNWIRNIDQSTSTDIINNIFSHCLKSSDTSIVKWMYRDFDIQLPDVKFHSIRRWQNLRWLISQNPSINNFETNRHLFELMCRTANLIDIVKLLNKWPTITYDQYDIANAIDENRLRLLKYMNYSDVAFNRHYSFIFIRACRFRHFSIANWINEICDVRTLDIHYNTVFSRVDCHYVVRNIIILIPDFDFTHSEKLLTNCIKISPIFFTKWLISLYPRNRVWYIIGMLLKIKHIDDKIREMFISFVLNFFDITELNDMHKQFSLHHHTLIKNIITRNNITFTNTKSALK